MLKLVITRPTVPLADGDGITLEERGPELAVFATDGPTLWAWLTIVLEMPEDAASELAGEADWV